MKFNPFTKAQELPDDALDEIAAEDEQRKAALAERERRAEVKAEAAEEEARWKAQRERQERIDALLRDHERTAAEVAETVAALNASLVATSALVKKRDALLGRAWGLQADLKALGAPSPSVSAVFSPEAKSAARRLRRLVDDLVESPLADAMRNHPEAFK